MKVLIVDDDDMTLNLLVRIATNAGHEVQGAASGSEALGLLQQERKFDRVITDYQLGDLTGDDVAKAAKEQNPATRILLISGLPRDYTYVDDFALKPFNIEKILEFVG